MILHRPPQVRPFALAGDADPVRPVGPLDPREATVPRRVGRDAGLAGVVHTHGDRIARLHRPPEIDEEAPSQALERQRLARLHVRDLRDGEGRVEIEHDGVARKDHGGVHGEVALDERFGGSDLKLEVVIMHVEGGLLKDQKPAGSTRVRGGRLRLYRGDRKQESEEEAVHTKDRESVESEGTEGHASVSRERGESRP